MAFILGVLVPTAVKSITKNSQVAIATRHSERKSGSNLVQLGSHSGENDQNVMAMGEAMKRGPSSSHARAVSVSPDFLLNKIT